MVEFAGESQFGAFVRFLNRHYPASKTARLVVLPGYDSIGDGDGNPLGWAAYQPEGCIIWCPGEHLQIEGMTADEVHRVALESIAHEYVHHLQHCEGRPFDEEEAEGRAAEIVRRWLEAAG